MKRKICIFLSIIIMTGIISGCRKDDADIKPEINQLIQEGIADNANKYPSLVNVYEGQATNYGLLNYSGEIYQMILDDVEYKAENSLGYINSMTHVIPDTDLYIYKNENNNWCSFSGAEQISLEGFAVKENDMDNIRNNRTGYLIGVFTNADEAEKARFEYIAAQKYINGESYPSVPTVVMNGKVRKDIGYYIQDEEYWISITDVLNARDINWKDEGNGITYSWLGEDQWLPATEIDNDSVFYNYDTEADEFFVDMMTWTGNFKLLQEREGKWYGEAEMISRVIGMEILISENLIIITSDPYDCPQEFYILNERDEYIPFTVYQE